jgi:phosphatidylcholine synthase
VSFQTIRAFTVHLLTASGAGLAFIALVFAVGGQWEAMFLTLGFALIVDGVDGPLARAFRVQDVLPRWSGDTLDLVVDFVTYVFLPAYAIAASGFMPPVFALVSGVVVCMSGAIYFADRAMKTEDNYFRGFPAVWNVVALYIFVLQPAPWLAAAAIVALAGLSFLPVRFLHPLRVRHWRWLNVALLVVWAGLALDAVLARFDPGPAVVWGLGIIAVYFFAVGSIRR